mgnify:CR=1 FL=1
MSNTRKEHDLLGDRDVPADAYYGVQTLRAFENFNITGVRLHQFDTFINAFVQVKKAAALANHEVGALDGKIKDAIVAACDEILDGKLHDQFIVDMIQGGAGTSTNMNVNEVIANRALEILGHQKGEYQYCHPNNHVNHGQSTNDTFPTGFRVALDHVFGKLSDAVEELSDAFYDKGEEFEHILKLGRTQLQDAVPMTLGQEFTAFAVNLEEELRHLEYARSLLLEVNLGATAIGTGLNAPPGYRELAVKYLAEVTERPFVTAADLIEATSDTGAYVMAHAACKRLASKLSKICNDLRLLSSGPRAGLNEINLPAMQAGSSIMPAKVNPVIPEVVNQITFKVRGNDFTVGLGAEAGQLQLNAMEPVIAQALFESIRLLKSGCDVLRTRCIDGITANKDVCERYVRESISVVTLLNLSLGHRAGDEVGQEAAKSGKSVRDIVLERGLLDETTVDRLLSFENLTGNEKISEVAG